tara:strand:- start:9781 stop:10440 length:660 start_codon:yes stop_codon:yes gene_type:complete
MKILIATPAYGSQVYTQYTESLVATCLMLKSLNIEFEIRFIGNQIVTRARNMLSYIFLKDESFTHLLFVDADVCWNPLDVKKLLEHDLECVIGVYPNKKYLIKNGTIGLNPSSVFSQPLVTKGENLVKVKYAATGFMLLNRVAFDRVKLYVDTFELPVSEGENATLYNFFDCNVVNGDYLTEDYYFSHLFNQFDGEIFADKSIRLKHIGFHVYGEDLNV